MPWFWPFSAKFEAFPKNFITYKRFSDIYNWPWISPKTYEYGDFFEKWSLEKFTLLKRSEIAILYLNTCNLHFMELKSVSFPKTKNYFTIYNALEGLVTDVINQKNPESNLIQLLKNGKSEKTVKNSWKWGSQTFSMFIRFSPNKNFLILWKNIIWETSVPAVFKNFFDFN